MAEKTAKQALDFVNLLDLMRHPSKWPTYQGHSARILALQKQPFGIQLGILVSEGSLVRPRLCFVNSLSDFRADNLHQFQDYKTLGDIIRDGWVEYKENPFVAVTNQYLANITDTSTTGLYQWPDNAFTWDNGQQF